MRYKTGAPFTSLGARFQHLCDNQPHLSPLYTSNDSQSTVNVVEWGGRQGRDGHATGRRNISALRALEGLQNLNYESGLLGFIRKVTIGDEI